MANPQFPEINHPSKWAFQIKNAKLFVPVVTLYIEGN